jgi:hypothetical protein
MTDISKYKTITVPISDWKTVEKMKSILIKDVVLSNSKVVSMLIKEKARELNGKLSK